MFSKRDPVEEDEGENGRDVFNEKPSAEEVCVPSSSFRFVFLAQSLLHLRRRPSGKRFPSRTVENRQ